MATRHERVVLELEDHFTRGMMGAASSTALLNRELNSLSGSAVKSNRSLDDSEKRVDRIGKSADRSGKQIDRLSGRLALLAQTAAVLGPALIPIGAAGIPAVAGLATELGAAAGAVGVAVLAFHGLGDGLKALNAYQLEPTAENLEKMRAEMDKLGPAGEHFVRYLDSLGPQLSSLQTIARDGIFPGMEDGITSLMALLPRVKSIVADVATAMGHLASEAGAGLAGDGFRSFFDYLDREAGPTLEALGHTVGAFAQGFANLVVAFGPLSRSFAQGFEGMARSFAEWSSHLDTNEGFQSFLEYLRQSGPQALEFLGALAHAFAGIVKAAAPVGQQILPVLTELAKGLAALADSPVGPMFFTTAAGMAVFARASAGLRGAMTNLGVSTERTTTAMSKLRSAGMALAALEIAGGAIEGLERSAAGAAPKVEDLTQALIHIGDAEFAKKFDGIADAMDALDRSGFDGIAQDFDNLGRKAGWAGTAVAQGLGSFTGMTDDMQRTHIEAQKAADAIGSLDESFAGLVTAAGPQRAQQMFDQLASAQHLSADEQRKLLDLMPKYGAALTDAKNQADLAASSSDRLAASTRAETNALQASITAMRAKREEASRALNAELNYKAAILDARDALKENGKSVNENTRAGQGNLRALYALADAWNGQSNAAKNATGSLKTAKANFVQTATNMGMAEDKARALAKRLFEIPTSHVTKFNTPGLDLAFDHMRAMKRELDSIDRNVDIYIRAHTTRLPSVSGMGPQLGFAAGGIVAGPTRHAPAPQHLTKENAR